MACPVVSVVQSSQTSLFRVQTIELPSRRFLEQPGRMRLRRVIDGASWERSASWSLGSLLFNMILFSHLRQAFVSSTQRPRRENDKFSTFLYSQTHGAENTLSKARNEILQSVQTSLEAFLTVNVGTRGHRPLGVACTALPEWRVGCQGR